MRNRLTLPLVLAIAWLGGAAPGYANIVINPLFEPSITGDPNAATIEGTINSAIGFYESHISTPITVPIAFGEGSGLGESITYIAPGSYFSYVTGLHAHSSGDATDTTALAHLPISSTNPVGGTEITAKVANWDALGIPIGGGSDPCGSLGTVDGCILLNTGITFPPQPNNGSNYSLLAVTEHEIDEVLGLGSGLDCSGTGCSVGTPNPEDLFRYTSGGSRSYSLNGETDQGCTGAPGAFFSLDGTTDLIPFNNCDNGGDYGDWLSDGSHLPAVQDAFGSPGASPSLNINSPEVVALDAIGYNLVSPAPEPATLTLLGVGLAGLGFSRRRKSN